MATAELSIEITCDLTQFRADLARIRQQVLRIPRPGDKHPRVPRAKIVEMKVLPPAPNSPTIARVECTLAIEHRSKRAKRRWRHK